MIIAKSLALARIVNYDGMLQTEAYLTIVNYDPKHLYYRPQVEGSSPATPAGTGS
jgi:hypothetical protein